MDDPIERLEIKIAFLENATNELSDMVFKQQQDIAMLNDRLAVLLTRFDAFKSTEGGYTDEEERPPHY
jgi:SlyX protein